MYKRHSKGGNSDQLGSWSPCTLWHLNILCSYILVANSNADSVVLLSDHLRPVYLSTILQLLWVLTVEGSQLPRIPLGQPWGKSLPQGPQLVTERYPDSKNFLCLKLLELSAMDQAKTRSNRSWLSSFSFPVLLNFLPCNFFPLWINPVLFFSFSGSVSKDPDPRHLRNRISTK
jgi:hypothetical protein